MNIPISWLKEAAQITGDTAQLLEKLTNAGNAVESFTKLGHELSGIIVGKIVSLTRHPDADKLWITQTDVGAEVLQIITGADNLQVGDYIPVATHGSTLAGGVKIKKGKMRGLDSNGMLCSISELGYTIHDFPEACEDGIYVLPGAHELGADICDIMQLREEVAEFDILSNRPDTNSIMGMAREAAAVYGNTLDLPPIHVDENASCSTTDMLNVTILDPVRCPRYTARIVTGIKVGPSPLWLRRKLTSAGVRPINNIVDITNYVMLEYGQPLHAFDISAVAKQGDKHNIIVRTAMADETITTLDGEQRILPPDTLLIADHEKAIGIAGIMGGENSKILESTTTILFESANFDAASIRKSSRALGMRTDASARYEKGQDPNQTIISVNRAMQLVQQLCCGTVAAHVVDVYPAPRVEHSIGFSPKGVNLQLGTPALTQADMCRYLNNIGILTTGCDDKVTACIPTFRPDITCQADIAEEVARFYGLNNIPPRFTQLLSGQSLPQNKAGKTPRRRRQDAIKNVLVALGYNESLTYPFESPKVFDKLCLPQEHNLRNCTTLKNPLGEDFSIMRTTTVGSMLDSMARNYSKGNQNVQLFEIAHIYSGLSQHQVLTFASYGTSYLDAKGDTEAIVAGITNRPLVFEACGDLPFMHPGRTAKISIKISPNPRDAAIELGYVGEIGPSTAANFEIGTRVYIAVLDMEVLHTAAEAYKFKFVAPAQYPPITRDIAFTVAENVPAAQLEAAIYEKGGQYLASVSLFDIYQGAQVGAGLKSVAYAITFRASDRTLTVPDIQKNMDAILQNLQQKYDAKVRA